LSGSGRAMKLSTSAALNATMALVWMCLCRGSGSGDKIGRKSRLDVVGYQLGGTIFRVA
jgi:hypothetical protein